MVPQARKLEKISYEEMLEMASSGAKVLQSRSVEFAKKYNVPVRVLSSFNDNPGTLVTKEDIEMENVVVSGIAYDKNQVKVTVAGVPDKPGVAAKIFGEIANNNIVVDMIIQNIGEGVLTDMSFTVPKTDSKKVMEVMKTVEDANRRQRCQFQGEHRPDFDYRSRYALSLGVWPHRLFAALAKERINIYDDLYL